jgi:hypothetical protein
MDKIIQSIIKMWDSNTITNNEINDLVGIQTKFNQTLQHFSSKLSQGCMYCILVRHEGEDRIKIGYSTFGMSGSGRGRYNIFNRLQSHYKTYSKYANLFIVPVHNETIERQFHKLAKVYELPLVIRNRRYHELYPADETIVLQLYNFLQEIVNNKQYESTMNAITIP